MKKKKDELRIRSENTRKYSHTAKIIALAYGPEDVIHIKLINQRVGNTKFSP
jgi:hypothetical protein